MCKRMNNNHLPVFLQIVSDIEEKILSQKIKPGEKLLSVREYGVHFGINPNTVQKAYTLLEEKGLTENKRGLGTFVSENPILFKEKRLQKGKDITRQFIEKMDALGFPYEECVQLMEELKSETKNK